MAGGGLAGSTVVGFLAALGVCLVRGGGRDGRFWARWVLAPVGGVVLRALSAWSGGGLAGLTVVGFLAALGVCLVRGGGRDGRFWARWVL
ncbi:hypothetical protein ABZ443_13225, partial [Streptomyces shenzhenensis]